MEASSLPESEQQQQQQRQQFQEQSTQQQEASLQYPQQQQQYQDYNYYNQAYDHSSYYHSYYQQQYPYQTQWQHDHHHQQQQQPQNYAYYQQPDYSATPYHQPPVYYQHDSAPPPPGVSLPQIADSGGNGHHHQPQGSVNPAVVQPGNGINPAVVQPGNGINPAAAAAMAALEQLTQFAGTMDAAERAMVGLPPVNTPGFELVSMRPPDGQHPHRGGGRRGGGPIRGGRRGNVGHNRGSAPPFRGKGRGKGKAHSRRVQPPSVASTSSYPEPSAPNEAAQSAPAPEKVAWCELCRVDCTSLEVLEQHKNGKRHKKNLLRIEELKKADKPGEEIRNDQEPLINTMPEESQQPQVAQDGVEQKSAENLTLEAASNEPRMVTNLEDNSGEKPEIPVEEFSEQQGTKPKMNSFDNRRRGIKRKMKGGRGGKRMKTSDTRRRPVEPPKPKVVIPLICELCNVKCDTREVLDRHRSGKKHIAKLKRFEGHQAVYGPTGLQALYPPNPIAQAHFVPPGPQPFYITQGSFPPQFPSQAHQSTAAAAVGLNPQFSQSSMPQQSEATSTLNPATGVLRL